MTAEMIARLAPIRAALSVALSGIESEIVGLSRRRELAREQTSVLLGSESGIYYQREAEEEKMLAAAEGELMMATHRVTQLQRQRDRLQQMGKILKSLFDSD